MTELERARAHLRQMQDDLAIMRRCAGNFDLGFVEAYVIAALEWVWAEQEKAREENRAEFRIWLDGIIAERFA